MNGRHSDRYDRLPCKNCGQDISRDKPTLKGTIDFLRDSPGDKTKVLYRNAANIEKHLVIK